MSWCCRSVGFFVGFLCFFFCWLSEIFFFNFKGCLKRRRQGDETAVWLFS